MPLSCRSISRWVLVRFGRVLRRVVGIKFILLASVLILGIVLLSTSNYRQADEFELLTVQQDGGDCLTVLGKTLSVASSTRQTATGYFKQEYDSRIEERDTKVTVLTKNTNMSYFAEKYAHHYAENNTLFFNYLKGSKMQTWKPSIRNASRFRDDLRAALGSAGQLKDFLLTKKNVKYGTRMRFYMMENRTLNMPAFLSKHLPDGPLYSPGLFKSCSVVGSSGILQGSRCGKEIDNASYVIRFNMAPVQGFEVDVGSKTSFTTLNPSFLRRKLNSLKEDADCSRYDDTVRQFTGSQLWLPAFAVFDDLLIIKRATEFANRSKIVEPILGHPEHFVSVATLWRRTFNVTATWPSTGLYMISSFFEVCDRINVFGFWPFTTTLDGSDVPYHYSDNVTGTIVHSFDTEFKSLVHLYERGIIKMHLGPCL